MIYITFKMYYVMYVDSVFVISNLLKHSNNSMNRLKSGCHSLTGHKIQYNTSEVAGSFKVQVR